ncbi:MAG TPA: hypothetical protein VNT60_08100, partial [Deinococcales bacterium]|nr:hypothetical protein [Deinococcales bacterium]
LTLPSTQCSVGIHYPGGSETLKRGESCILPAALGEARVVPNEERASLIACYVPDLQEDVVRPLQAAGHSLDAIRTLGHAGV